jgi:hypothetical protein
MRDRTQIAEQLRFLGEDHGDELVVESLAAAPPTRWERREGPSLTVAQTPGGTNPHEPLPVFHTVGRTAGSWSRSFLPDEIFEGGGHGRRESAVGPANLAIEAS